MIKTENSSKIPKSCLNFPKNPKFSGKTLKKPKNLPPKSLARRIAGVRLRWTGGISQKKNHKGYFG